MSAISETSIDHSCSGESRFSTDRGAYDILVGGKKLEAYNLRGSLMKAPSEIMLVKIPYKTWVKLQGSLEDGSISSATRTSRKGWNVPSG